MPGGSNQDGAADTVSMQTEAMVTTAQFLSTQVDLLETELKDIQRQWAALSATWTGKAATSFEDPWDEWSDAAVTVTAILSDSSDLLVQSVQLMVENENAAAAALSLTDRSAK